MSTQQACLGLMLVTAGLASTVHAQATLIDPGLGTPVEVLQADPGQPDNFTIPIPGGALLSVSSTGARTLLSDFGNSTQGPIGSGELTGLALAPTGLLGLGQTLLVTDAEAGTHAGALFTVDPSTGNRSLLSDFGNPAQGVLGDTPIAVTYAYGLLGLDNAAYVLDNFAGTNGQGGLFEIDLLTGNRILLSDFGNSAQGATGENPISIAALPAGVLSGILGNNGGFVVLDADKGTNGDGAVFVVDHSGHRTLLSDLGDSTQGVLGADPQGIATAPAGLLGLGTAIYVADNAIGTNGDGAVYQILANGHRVLTSDLGNSAQGPTGLDPLGITAASGGGGNLLVVDDMDDQVPTQAQLFLINPTTGNRSSASTCSNVSLGDCQTPNAVTQ